MSVDFYPAIIENVGTPNECSAPALRCACCVVTDGYDCAACRAKLNMANENARDLLHYLGILDAIAEGTGGIAIRGDETCGRIQGALLATLCRNRMAMVNVEPERAERIEGRLITSGRSAGYLLRQTRSLLVIAMLARCGWVAWS